MAIFHTDCTDFTNDIDAPLADVWSFFADIENWPKWTRAIVRSFPISTGGFEPGYQFVMYASFAPKIPLKIEMFEYEEKKLIGWGVRNPLITVIHRFHWEDLGNGRCRVRNHEFAEGPLAPLCGLLMGKRIDTFDRQWAGDLEAHFKARRTAA